MKKRKRRVKRFAIIKAIAVTAYGVSKAIMYRRSLSKVAMSFKDGHSDKKL